MRDLAVQAANDGSQNAASKGAANTEFQQLTTELDNISTTAFNGQVLLDGSFARDFQVGANNGDTLNIAVGTAMTSTGLGGNGLDLPTGAARAPTARDP